ncbi:60 kDa outer membrane protein, serovars L1/L2/L3 [Blastopirellula marina DSM 3645]|uniref:60 kDa outer membrane protein, serovars L1/L2/L3 n=1 Tax=Blastopirellula marina DSM 3645 TaxID=314230 RepID=A4A0M0_9BACT|nr:60 kDa outer membrane protein, serovars L1/L2/L3 [Blastopirellula marina DSM 3645]
MIYLEHYSGAGRSPDATALDEAPLFSPDSFPTLGSNARTQAPTIVLSTSAASLPNPADPPQIDVQPTPSATPPTIAPSTTAVVAPATAGLESLTAAQLLIEAEQSLADGKSLRAYRTLSLLLQRKDLSVEERAKTFALLEPLAEKIVFAPHKHLALPAVTIKSGVTVEQIAKEHQIPASFLRAVNDLSADQQPELGDALKVIDGPLALHLHADREELTLWTNNGFARRFEWNDLPATLQNGPNKIIRNVNGESTTITLADIALYDSAAETSADAWKQLANLLDAETTMMISGVAQVAPEKIVAATASEAKVVSAEAPAVEPMLPEAEISPETLAPLDALRVEVFSPPKPIAVGSGANFGLRVINLSDKPAPNVSAIIFFSEGLEPVKIEGAEGKVAVGQAAFRPLTIAPRGHVDLEVLATVNDYGRQIYRVEVRCDAWDAHLVSEVAVSALNEAPQPPKLELSDKPEAPSKR